LKTTWDQKKQHHHQIPGCFLSYLDQEKPVLATYFFTFTQERPKTWDFLAKFENQIYVQMKK
jgi:hypothetical protein